MIVIFCGSDTALSRQTFSDTCLKESGNQGTEIVALTSNLEEKLKSAEHEQSLFSSKRLYTAENILSKKKLREILEPYEGHKTIDIYIWEEQLESRFIKMYFKKSKINVFDIPSSIWKLLDNLQPGSKSQIISQLCQLSDSIDEHLLLFLIQKRAKELILASKDLTGGKKLADWQISRLHKQAKVWKETRLISFYEKLYAVEKAERTDATPYTIKQALEILFCFYL